MNNFEKIAKTIIEETNYITNPDQYIDEKLSSLACEISPSEKCDLYFLILEHNQKKLKKLQSKISELENKKNISTQKPRIKVNILPNDLSSNQLPQISGDDSLSKSRIDNILLATPENQVNMIKSLTEKELILFKLYLLKKKNELQKELREVITINPFQDITSLQQELININNLLKLKLSPKVEIKEDEKESPTTHTKIVFVRSASNQSYFASDITSYPERQKEIKIIVDKIMSGFFLDRKGIKSLEGYNNLHEFSSPNGARVLYSLINDNICIISLFWKDKQKSKKITSYYVEAKNRFASQEQYLKDNIGTADFEIEQLEIIGQINSLVDSEYKLAKKVGDNNE